jgi:hypothetical protein
MRCLSQLLRALGAAPTSRRRAVESIPPQLDHRWDEQLLPLLSPTFPIAVCWSAKAGCTTVLKWFLAHNGLLEEAVAHSSWVHDYREQRLCEGLGYRQMCEQLFTHSCAETFIVKVIRDPAKRAISGYLHLLRQGHQSSWLAGATVKRWKRENGLGRQRGISFRQFLSFLDSEQARGCSIDPHFRPQYEPLQDPRVHSYIPLEHLAAGLAELENHFRLPCVDVQSLSVSSHHNPASRHCNWPEAAATVPAHLQTLETLGTPAPEAFLDAQTFELVQKVYRTDYEAFGEFYSSEMAAAPMPPTLPSRIKPSSLSHELSTTRHVA